MYNERVKRLDRFYEDEFPSFVMKYYNEFCTQYPIKYNCLGRVQNGEREISLFQYIEEYIVKNYNIPYSINKDFDFHNASLFYATTNDFGFTINAKDRKSIPKDLVEQYISKAGYIYEFGLFAHCFLGLKGVSRIINSKIKADIEVECELIKLRLKSYLKRFFIQGGVDWRWIVLDQIFFFGIDKFPNCLDHEFNQLEYSIRFFERNGHLGEMDNLQYVQHKYYKKEKEFYSELKKRSINDYTYVDVLKEKLIFKNLKHGNVLTANCRELGEIPVLKLKNKLSFINSNGNYYEPYFNYLTYRLNNSSEEIFPYEFPINFKLSISDVINDEEVVHQYLETYNEPENGIREMFNLPKIGEGWISETNLYYEIKSHLSSEVVVQHGRPKWLGKQHLDIYIPRYNIGIEFQGDQHFYPIEYFGGVSSFIKNQERDKNKKQLCEQNNCHLIYVNPGYDKTEVIAKVEAHILKRRKHG
jgi:hypothetical protein